MQTNSGITMIACNIIAISGTEKCKSFSPQARCSTWSCCCRSSSPKKYPLTEEEADVWRHDKFDLLKVKFATNFALSADCLCFMLLAKLPLLQGENWSCFCR